MAAHVMFERDLFEVIQKLLALREIACPVVARSERERIGMIRGIDAAAWIAVDVPGAAELGVLLDDGVGNAEPAEADAQRDGADSGADDEDVIVLRLLDGR